MPDLLERLKEALADRYAVESEIGRGGMATVFLAHDPRHDRRVAIKVLHPELAASLGTDRFLREIKIAAGLQHPHILPLFDSGEADGLLYFVMPHVEGESLRGRLEREGQLPIDVALSVAAEVADGLQHAHGQGVIHRDIKPANILFSGGHAVIADFGVARALGVASEGDTTATGLAVGTPKYMSPEQAAGATEVDGRSDIYALGCVLWEMLAGEPPWDAPTPRGILARKTQEEVPDLRVRRKTVPSDVEAVIARAMALAPADRFATAREFAQAIEAPESHGREERRRRVVRRLIGVAAALALLVSTIWLARPDMDNGSTAIELDPDAIAVMPFQVVGGDDALQVFAAGMPDLFWMTLTGEYGPSTVDRGTVARLWADAVGATGTPISEAQAVEIAQAVGAGRLLDGLVSGTAENMTLTASLVEVPSGRVRVRPVTVEGPYEDRFILFDELVNQLLAADYGPITEPDLPSLSRHDPAAVQAYLAADFDKALALDSTFLLAAIVKYEQGERDVEVARLLWEHLDELSPRDRANVLALLGWRFGATRTLVERFAQYEPMAKHDWDRGDLVWQLWAFGRVAGIPGYRSRVRAVMLYHRERGGDGLWGRSKLSDIAATEGDTAAMRLYAEGIDSLASSSTDSMDALAVRLRVALMQADREATERLWEEIGSVADNVLNYLDPLMTLLVDGRGLDGLDRFMLSEEEARPGARRNTGTGLTWARARGRYADWRTIRDGLYERLTRSPRYSPLTGAILQLRDALFLGEPEDSSVLAAASWLDSVALGVIEPEPEPDDPEPETRARSLARCWSTLWKTAHGHTEGAREEVRYLQEGVPFPYRYSVCAGLIEALIAEQEGGDFGSAVARLDLIVRPVPMEQPGWYVTRDATHWIDNLFLSRKFQEVGDTVAALEATRRAKPWNAFNTEITGGIFVDLLREEARLTAMVGDTAGAIDAYEHYFNLRDARPESPHWAAQWDSMRVEYGTLTGVEGP